MKQFSYEIVDSDNLEETLKDARRYLDTVAHTTALTHVFSGHTDRMRLETVVRAIKAILPETKIVGATSGGEIREGLLTPCSIVVVVTVFECADVSVHEFTFGPGEEERYGRIIAETIDAQDEIKAAELMVDCAAISTATLFPVINKCQHHVQIYGAVPYAHDLKKPMYVFTDDHIHDVTVILITYAGKELFVSTDHVIGWKPVGTGMRVTKATGSVLNTLDDRPALSIYSKYLQIPNDEHFYENAFEFPFLRYSNATYMMRLPYAGLPDGSIELRAPIEEGDVMYLSYGDVPTILGEILEARGRFERFCPQYIRLHNCATRKTFWGTDINREIQPFQEVAPTTGFLTGGEILRVNDELVHFNATIVVIGMREGPLDPDDLRRTRSLAEGNGMNTPQTSMVRRMANFINVAMQELVESNKRLESLAKTDGLTMLNNRRETSRIIGSYHETGRRFCLIMADLDGFKQVNDEFGHDVGDQVLITVADLIKDSIKNVRGATAGRWGGEEFMVVLPDTTLDQAQSIAEILRENIEEHDFGEVHEMTISLGVADSETYRDMKSIYHNVDQALYAAKAAGKNTVILAGKP